MKSIKLSILTLPFPGTVYLVLLLCVFFVSACSDDGNTDAGAISIQSVEQDEGRKRFEPVAIENFKLLDHKGKAHELFYYDDASAIVIMVQGNGCPIVRNALPDFRQLVAEFQNKNIRFFLLNSNLQDNSESIAVEAAEWDIDIPILDDDDQLVGETLGLSRTAEVLVVDPKAREIIYRGPLNDRLSYERQKESARNHYVKDAIEAQLAGETVYQALEPTKGCLINFARAHGQQQSISYVNDIVPILQEKCLACHKPGGIAPWAMTSYEMLKGFAPMIREVVKMKRMPPWHADPAHSNWLEYRGLSIEERRTLVHWIESGAQRGEGEDPLLTIDSRQHEWSYGEPDLIVKAPSFTVPATGLVEYQYFSVDNPLDKDVWVTAASVKPGDPQAIHHLYAGVGIKGELTADMESNHQASTDGYLTVWSPGSDRGIMPEGTAVLLPKGSTINFEMHYTPYGKKTVDRTQLGLYFTDEKPKKILRYSEVVNHFLSIPAGAREYEVQAYHYFEKDAHIYTMIPHAHYRGKSSRFLLEYPDGRIETLLSVPYYDFNWQIGYTFPEPKPVPAGSRIIHQTTYDNSIHNESNPDPGRIVPWGSQSKDEMLFGPFTFTWDDETPDNVTHSRERLLLARKMGFIDKNFDGKIARSELERVHRREFFPLFHRGDQDKDDHLTFEELMSAFK